jgi:hypothetical protein
MMTMKLSTVVNVWTEGRTPIGLEYIGNGLAIALKISTLSKNCCSSQRMRGVFQVFQGVRDRPAVKSGHNLFGSHPYNEANEWHV